MGPLPYPPTPSTSLQYCFYINIPPSRRISLYNTFITKGIEATVDADESLQLPGSDSSALFDMWVNTCPGQGSRTIRTEEAVLITLARMRAHVLRNQG